MLSNDSSAAASPPCPSLLVRHQRLIQQLCRRLLRNAEDAEDAAQETLVRAIASWHRLDPDRPLVPWLRTIAINRCRTRWQRSKNEISRSPVAIEELASGGVAGDASLELERAELVAQIHGLLANLPAPQVQAFLAVQRDGSTHREVAQRMQMPVGTVKTWVHRTRLALIDRLAEPELTEPGDSRCP